jgi:hypothetical protein
MSLDAVRFQQLISDARDRRSSGAADSMVVPAHLSQMRLFMVRQGVEFFCKQDQYGQRREFLRRLNDYNELPGRLEAMIDAYLLDGKGLLYARPSKDLYRIHYFTEEQYRTYYDEDGGLEELQIIYPFQVRTQPGFGMDDLGAAPSTNNSVTMGLVSGGSTRWVMMRVLHDRIEQTITNERPQFDAAMAGRIANQTKRFVNSLGFIPGVEVFNNRGLTAGTGHGEFDWLSGYILEHDRMTRNIRKNLRFFGTPTLVSSRPKSDLLQPDEDGGRAQRATLASNSGFSGGDRRGSRSSDPGLLGADGELRIPRLIANVESTDRVQYISPDPVPGDLTGYTQQYQELIRSALGGVDDLSISSGATAYEVRTLYGRVQATAKRKARDFYEYGFCRLFSLLLMNEERLFRDSFAAAIGMKKPVPVLVERLPFNQRNPRVIQQLEATYRKQLDQFGNKLNAALEEAKQQRALPPGVIGLVPDGDTRVSWRWEGDVFELSTQELLQNSIVTRNLQELGVDSIEALQYLFPEKTPEERAAMLGGFPFRMVEATQRSVGIFVDLMRALMQVPHPAEPDLPMAADPAFDLTPYLLRSLGFLRQELSYSGTFSNADPATIPTSLSDADRVRAAAGEPTELERQRDERRAKFRTAGADGSLWQWGPMGSGVPGADGPAADSDALVPALGGTLGYDPTNPYPGTAGQLGTLAGPSSPTAAGPAMAGPNGGAAFGLGAADLAAPSNAGVPALWVDGLPGPAAGPAGGGPAAGPGSTSRPARRAGRRRRS